MIKTASHVKKAANTSTYGDVSRRSLTLVGGFNSKAAFSKLNKNNNHNINIGGKRSHSTTSLAAKSATSIATETGLSTEFIIVSVIAGCLGLLWVVLRVRTKVAEVEEPQITPPVESPPITPPVESPPIIRPVVEYSPLEQSDWLDLGGAIWTEIHKLIWKTHVFIGNLRMRDTVTNDIIPVDSETLSLAKQ